MSFRVNPNALPCGRRRRGRAGQWGSLPGWGSGRAGSPPGRSGASVPRSQTHFGPYADFLVVLLMMSSTLSVASCSERLERCAYLPGHTNRNDTHTKRPPYCLGAILRTNQRNNHTITVPARVSSYPARRPIIKTQLAYSPIRSGIQPPVSRHNNMGIMKGMSHLGVKGSLRRVTRDVDQS
jgi:hypothetical protein